MAHLQADHLVLGLRSVYLGMAVLVSGRPVTAREAG